MTYFCSGQRIESCFESMCIKGLHTLDLSRKNRHKVKLMSNYFFQIQQVRDTLKLNADVWGYSKSHYI